MKGKLLITLAAVLLGCNLHAQQLPSGLEVDTVQVVRAKGLVNDYSMIGVNFGPTVSRLFLNPSGYRQSWLYNPWYFSVSYIKYMKMFDFLPYFGYQIGLAYGHEGYKFKLNKEGTYLHTISYYDKSNKLIRGGDEASINVVEVPFLIHGHVDGGHFKFMMNAGPYVGYRLGIVRRGENVDPAIKESFTEFDNRWDYGLYGGVGFALVFDPIEIHFNAIGHVWSWSSLYTPDSSPHSYNQYYYRFAYPLDLNFTAGIYFQLGKRYGKTTKQIKQEAYDIVYGEDQSQDRQ